MDEQQGQEKFLQEKLRSVRAAAKFSQPIGAPRLPKKLSNTNCTVFVLFHLFNFLKNYAGIWVFAPETTVGGSSF